MLFNSIEFFLFLPIVWCIYWAIGNRRLTGQNAFLLVASYFFYGWWDYRFLALIFVSSLTDFCLGKAIERSSSSTTRRGLLTLSVVINLGILGFFKYCNFFAESFQQAFSFFGGQVSSFTLEVVLPVGISFYTFQTLSYTIDVYRRKMTAVSDVLQFFTFVSFFPQLVAGPIERAQNLLPQFNRPRVFDLDEAKNGLRQILWGLFKKVVIADGCAHFVNLVYSSPDSYTSSTILLVCLLFSIQIYGDFSGYSDIAIGVSKLFGFRLMQNFAYPYFSRDIAEFWRRWHISLTTWFRDYVYIPLGGSRVGRGKVIRNVFIVFILSGFWHGANWTFVLWGGIHALLFVPLLLNSTNRRNLEIVGDNSKRIRRSEFFLMTGNFLIVSLVWVFFRANSVGEAWHMLTSLVDRSLFEVPCITSVRLLCLLGMIAFMFVMEWINRQTPFGLDIAHLKWKVSVRWGLYILILGFLWLFGSEGGDFIYFQF